ncbi:hypothetical protein MRX96_047299 [Rhipicephalus microplus]
MARANVPRFFLVQFLGLWSLQLLEPSGPRTPFPPSAVRPWPDATPLLPEDHAVGLFWSSNQPVFGASRIPLSVSDYVGPLLRKVFPKCDVAKRYGCARAKTTLIVGEMAGHAQECVVSALKRRVFAVASDGSNESQAQLQPIVATFFAEESGLIESKLVTLSTLEGPSTGRNIANY